MIQKRSACHNPNNTLARTTLKHKLVLFIVTQICVLTIIHHLYDNAIHHRNNTESRIRQESKEVDTDSNEFETQESNWRNLTSEQIGNLSNLGRRLFLEESAGEKQDRNFTIHVWKHLKKISNRFIKRYTKDEHDPFKDCSVNNCKITSADEEVAMADAVLFHMHRMSGPPGDVPRLPHQLWVWLADESPHNVMMVAKDRNLKHYTGYFNWSMTYRMDSDVPVPYGRTVRLPEDETVRKDPSQFYEQKPKNVSIMGSNCSGRNGRYQYVSELRKHIPVDVYGGCGALKCPGHFNKDCPLLNDYKFYLSFENSNCDDYITEKLWWNALGKGSVPVVMGTSRANYERLLPPGSFIYAEDFDTPELLANHLRYLLDNPDVYSQYHTWRSKYLVLNEHGYFQSPVFHFCRLCEALNYNSRSGRAEADLEGYFDPKLHCYPKKWHT